MKEQKRFLVDVGMNDLPLPIKVLSKVEPEGQHTVAQLSIVARIMREFEPSWIDTFINIAHQHRGNDGTKTVRENIKVYLKKLHATSVRVAFDYPYFIEKTTPVSQKKCLVQYHCRYEAKISSIKETANVVFKIIVPAITTYPISSREHPKSLFGQISKVSIEIQPKKEIYAEDLVALVDKCALAPIYSYLSQEDQMFLIEKIHTEQKSSVVMTSEIKDALVHNKNVEWYDIQCANYGMLHSYSTMISTEKSSWIPFGGQSEEP